MTARGEIKQSDFWNFRIIFNIMVVVGERKKENPTLNVAETGW